MNKLSGSNSITEADVISYALLLIGLLQSYGILAWDISFRHIMRETLFCLKKKNNNQKQKNRHILADRRL